MGEWEDDDIVPQVKQQKVENEQSDKFSFIKKKDV